jgi:hypothetical protein
MEGLPSVVAAPEEHDYQLILTVPQKKILDFKRIFLGYLFQWKSLWKFNITSNSKAFSLH